MTIEEYQAKVQTLAAQYESQAIDSIVAPNASELLGTLKNRIVLDGKNSSNAPTGRYSQRPAYFPPSAYFKQGFTPMGKTGESEFKNGKPHQTEYFPNGYYGLRDKQGLPVDRMTMSYTGSMMLSYQMQARSNDVVLGFINLESEKLRKAHEAKRGLIFYATAEEMQDYTKNVARDSEKLTRGLLK